MGAAPEKNQGTFGNFTGKPPVLRLFESRLTLCGLKLLLPAAGRTCSSQLLPSHVAAVLPLQATEMQSQDDLYLSTFRPSLYVASL